MRKFDQLVSVAAPYNESDVDTDAIFPARFLLLLNRRGLGKHLFNDLRTSPDAEDPFVLDRPEFSHIANTSKHRCSCRHLRTHQMGAPPWPLPPFEVPIGR